jgi:hypothetical protein
MYLIHQEHGHHNMAHFAELDATNKVIRIVVVDNSNVSADMALDGEQWCENNIDEDPAISYVGGKYPGVAWKQTSYNNNFRKRYAAIGGYFIDDSGEGYFTAPKQFDDWVLNTADGAYYPPVAMPPENKQTYSADSKTWHYNIEYDQTNKQWICYEVFGASGAYFRTEVKGDGSLEDVAVSSPTASQIAKKVWDGTNWS